MINLSKIYISKLFGNHTLEISVVENRLLLIAENGSGKSTILRMIYYFLSKQWAKLLDIDFEFISIWINGKEIKFERSAFANSKDRILNLDFLFEKYPLYKETIKQITEEYDINDIQRTRYLAKEIESKFDIPMGLVLEIVEELSKAMFGEFDFENNHSDILYLPTYRRIERSFGSIFPELDNQFALTMERSFPAIRERILLEKKQSEDGVSETELDLKRLFSDLWRSIDYERWRKSSESPEHIEFVEFGMDDVEYKLNYILSLLKDSDHVKDNQKLEQTIMSFIELCNKYLEKNKNIIYDSSSKKISVRLKSTDKAISLNALSSGEKQILSLFSHLYLSRRKQCFVIIDEPEISLSLQWQEVFLHDIVNGQCSGLIVATHSPFIVSEEFKKYTFALNEFII